MSTKEDLLDLPDDIPVRTLRPIPQHELVVSDSRRVTHHLFLSPGTTLDDIQVPDVLKLVAFKLHRGDIIVVEPLDGSFYAEVLIRECNREFARTALLFRVDLPPLFSTGIDDLPEGMHVSFCGPERLWGCFRGTELIKHHFATRTDAAEYLRSTLR